MKNVCVLGGNFMRVFIVFFVLLLLSCGGAPAPTAQQVAEGFKGGGLDAENIRDEPLPDSAPVPRSYTSHANFTIPSAGTGSDGKTRGGQVFVCDTKKNCDAVFAFFDSLKALAGPYLYQSQSGFVVVQLNSKLKPDLAAKYEAIVKALP